ncbi:unnamed protein product [Effrenium voratum]|uniref:Importin subunit beta-1/Transportin-1-like TPR repeats domain-containing protein n=2 Tax=Effrenium voratum TaxID=2562239 RepID=A0AA36NGK6_9DINO|nr:unnamed protein product [Effrenium voratum]
MAFPELLRQCLAPKERGAAEGRLLELRATEPAQFAVGCAQALQDAQLPAEVRQMAAWLLRGALPLTGAAAAVPLQAALLQALESPALCRAAALCCAKMPWPQLVPQLLQLGQRGFGKEALKAMALLAEEGAASSSSAASMAEAALKALQAPDLATRLAAVEALTALLPKAAGSEQAVLAAALGAAKASELRLEALRLLEVCARECYDVISGSDLQQLAEVAAGCASGSELVASQALEVWEALAAKELEMAQRSRGLLGQAAPLLLPLLQQGLQRKPEDPGWQERSTLQDSARACLMATAKVLGDAVLQPILAFASTAMGSEDMWQRRAALLAFGAVQDGPSAPTLQPLVQMALPRLLEALTAPSVEASSAFWALGRLLELHPAAVPDDAQARIFEVAVLRLTEPCLAEQLCYCLDGVVDQQAAVLEPRLFGTVAESLLKGAQVADPHSRAHLALFGCLNELLARAAEDCLPQMELVLEEVMRRADVELSRGPVSRSLLSCLRVVLQRVSERSKRCGPALGALLDRSLRLDPTEEEALRAIGSLAALGDAQAVVALWPFLLSALRVDLPDPCLAAISAVTDVAKALGECFAPLGASAVEALAAVAKAGGRLGLRATQGLSAIFEVLGRHTPHLPELLALLQSLAGPKLEEFERSQGAVHESQELLEVVLLAHEALLCQGDSAALAGSAGFALRLLPAMRTAKARRGALKLLRHLAQEAPLELRAFLAQGAARSCATELVMMGAASPNSALREAANTVRALL